MIKLLTNSLAILGLLVLIAAVVGRFVGNPSIVAGVKVINTVIAANTLLLLAVVNKLLLDK